MDRADYAAVSLARGPRHVIWGDNDQCMNVLEGLCQLVRTLDVLMEKLPSAHTHIHIHMREQHYCSLSHLAGH